MADFLMLDEFQIGTLESVSVDHFWCYGKFRRGKDFALVAERLALLERAYSEAEEDDNEVDPYALQEEIDKLGLAVVSNGIRVKVRGFKLQGEFYEYRIDTTSDA